MCAISVIKQVVDTTVVYSQCPTSVGNCNVCVTDGVALCFQLIVVVIVDFVTSAHVEANGYRHTVV